MKKMCDPCTIDASAARIMTEEDLLRILREAHKITDLPIQISIDAPMMERMTNPKFALKDMQIFAQEKLKQLHDNKDACGIQFTLEESVGAYKILKRIFDIQ